ncbi:hypothetical protein [Roseibium sediminicola]|uniref:DUF5666 domain-containing protein n=1 Tax=Roseibium sediminicola TaxID=2933272 RepID=A0ABT0GSF3_9HYPH|nr:hypothetical protein [Roseibium sp. CAU 1639]MCK7612353.1 hypothetical protein [Roseibium sp. CAU 1639]
MTTKLLTCTALLLGLALTACNSVETKTSLVTPTTHSVRTAGPGDVVMSFGSRRSLPNAFGKADAFGRTTNAGGTTVRYVGSRGGNAIFERTDVAVTSDATTMSETPVVIPSTTRTNISGTVGTVPVSGTATSTSYKFIPARGSSQYATQSRPIQFSLGKGQSVKVSGRTLRVVGVGASSVDYRIE